MIDSQPAQSTECHVQSFLEHLQGQGLHHFPAQPLPVPDNALHEENPLDVQPDPPLVQLEVISSPVPCAL